MSDVSNQTKPADEAPAPWWSRFTFGMAVSLFVLFGFFGMLGFLLTRPSFEKMGEIQNVLFTLLGALAAAFTQVVNYWLGSSKDSADKTQLLVERQDAATAAAQSTSRPATGSPRTEA